MESESEFEEFEIRMTDIYQEINKITDIYQEINKPR